MTTSSIAGCTKAQSRALMLDPILVKIASEAAIRASGGDASPALPQIGLDELTLRSSAEVAQRAVVLNVLVNVSFGVPPPLALQWLESHDLIGTASADELGLLQTQVPLDDVQRNRLRWNIESLWAAAWSGSLVDDLEPAQAIADTLASLLPNPGKGESPNEFLERYRLRALSEIYPKLDYLYRAHWYARKCQLTGKDPAPFSLVIVQSRRRLLEWVTHADVDWEDGDLST
jgi:hypothetical protein